MCAPIATAKVTKKIKKIINKKIKRKTKKQTSNMHILVHSAVAHAHAAYAACVLSALAALKQHAADFKSIDLSEKCQNKQISER